jgi:hypothetical protein
MIERVRDWVPLPHDVEQELHAVKAVTSQCDGQAFSLHGVMISEGSSSDPPHVAFV